MTSSTKNRRAGLGLETLEERCNPSSFVQNGELVIQGTGGNDTVTVNYQAGMLKVTENGVIKWHSAAQVFQARVRFTGFAGNDSFANNTGLNTIAFGNAGNDYLQGGTVNDLLDGGIDNDILVGSSGDDTLRGQAGMDSLFGMLGNDTLDGGDDGISDYLKGGPGADQFQQDMFWNGMMWVNRDAPADFVAGDSYFG